MVTPWNGPEVLRRGSTCSQLVIVCSMAIVSQASNSSLALKTALPTCATDEPWPGLLRVIYRPIADRLSDFETLLTPGSSSPGSPRILKSSQSTGSLTLPLQ